LLKTIPHVFAYSQQWFVITLLPHIVFTRKVVCFKLLMAHGYVDHG